MTSSISQFNITYDSLQDRLILKVLTSNDEETRVWLTRRFVQTLFNVTAEQLKRLITLEEVAPAFPFAQPVMQNETPATPASRSQVFSQPNQLETSKEYQATENTVVLHGEEPLLVSGMTIQSKAGDELILKMWEQKTAGVEVNLNLNIDLLQSLMQILQDSCQNAQWGLLYKQHLHETSLQRAGASLH